MIRTIISKEELAKAIEQTAVYGARHAHYKHTVKVAKRAYQYMTGEDQDDIILEYKTDETPEGEQQRLRVTNSVTQYISNSVKAQFEELARVDNVVENYYYPESGDSFREKEKEIESRLDVFYANNSLKDYLHEAVLHLNFYDPNAFIVVEMCYEDGDQERKKKPWTYPLEVYADQAVNYHMENGVLQWLVANQKVSYVRRDAQGGQEEVIADKFTLYAAKWNIVFQELPDDVEFEIPEGWAKVIYSEPSKEDKTFIVKYYDTKIDINPAIRVGYIKDPATNRETCVNPLWPADKIYRDLIWTKSEYDLSKALHGFYQKFQYAEKCGNKDPDTGEKCCRGKIGGRKCSECKGTGVNVHTSVQDVILLSMPETRDKIIPLSDLIHYETIPIELIERNNKDIQENEAKVLKAVFQRDLINKAEITSTATEVRVTENSKYNILSTYGKNYSRVWMHCVEVTAYYLEDEEGLIIDHEISSDFVIETLGQLFEQRQKAIAAQAPYQVIRQIDRKILMKQNRGEMDNVKRMEAKENWRPLREKSESERLTIITGLASLHPLKVRYQYFEEIFDEIFATKPEFVDMAYEGQKEIVNEIVDRIIAESEEDNAKNNAFRSIIAGETDTDAELEDE